MERYTESEAGGLIWGDKLEWKTGVSVQGVVWVKEKQRDDRLHA